MPVIAKCRDCGKQYRLRDDLAGSVLPCKACGAEFRVPGATSGAARPAARPAPARRDARGARKSRYGAPADEFDDRDDFEWDDRGAGHSKSIPLTYWLIGGGALAVVLIGLVVGVVMFSGKKDNAGDDNGQLAQNDGTNNGNTDTDPSANQNGNLNNGLNNPGNGGNVGNGNNGQPVGGEPNRRNRFGGQPKRGANNNNNVRNQPPVGRKPGNLQPANNNPPPGFNNKPQEIVRNNNNNQPATKPIPRTTPFGWTAKPDPPAQPIVFENKGKLIVASPARSGGDAIYPSSNSAFVAVGSNRDAARDMRVVKDLRDNTKVGEIRGLKLFFSRGVLSPDGAHFAAFSRDEKGIVLYDVKGKRRLGLLPIDDEKTKNGFRLEILDFAGPNRLVAAGRDTPLWVWEVPSGKSERSIPMPKSITKESLAFSPGGKYLAFFSSADSKATVHVTDLSTGNSAGTISMPKEFGSFRFHGMGFSPDGTELAAFVNIFFAHRVYCWNFSNGQLATSHAFEKDPKSISSNYKGPAVQWFPDKKRWLAFGNVVIDRDSGKTIWTVPKIPGSTHDSEARLLGSDRIAIVGRQGRVTALATMDVSQEELDKATKLVQSGGNKNDVHLPPLKKVDASTAKRIPIEGVAGRWTVAPDPAPKAAGPLLPASMPVGLGLGRIKNVQLSRADGAIAIVASDSVGGAAAQPAAGEQKAPELRLDRYDVAGGKLVDSFDVTFKSTLMAVSPSGKRAAVRFNTDEERVDVFALDTKTPYAGFRPYLDEKKGSPRKITEAWFVDEDHLLTLSGAKKLVLWKMPEGSAVYVIDNAQNPRLSPGGRFLSLTTGKSCRFFHALTGEPAGDVHLGATAYAVGFHPNGEKAALTFVGADGIELGVINLRDGKLESKFPIPVSSNSVEWCGDGHVLMNDSQLVDLNAKSVVWSYRLARGSHAPTSPDGRHWYIAGTTPVTLNAVQLPDAATKQRLAGKDLSPQMLLKPGMKVSLSVQLQGVAEPNFTNTIIRDWTAKLEQRGFTVAQGQRVVLTAQATMSNTGKSVTFKPSMFSRFRGGNNRGSETVAQTAVNCQIAFNIGGTKFAERKMSITNVNVSRYFSQRVFLKQGESVTTHLQKSQTSRAAGFFRGYYPPSHIFAPKSINGVGYSDFTAGGTKPLTN